MLEYPRVVFLILKQAKNIHFFLSLSIPLVRFGPGVFDLQFLN
jgi:hypothetical protein